MTSAIVLAFASAFCFGAGLVLTQLGLRHLSPLSGAAIAIPSSTLLLICISPVALAGSTIVWSAVAIFAAVGLLYPGAATLLTFAANRALGPVITGTLGNLAPLFAVALAFVMLGEPLRPAQLGGLVAIVAGVVLLTA
jgi:drug/metabolite transporter (DMT)-like permease